MFALEQALESASENLIGVVNDPTIRQQQQQQQQQQRRWQGDASEEDAVRYWAGQMDAQVEALASEVHAIPTDNVGIVASAARGLKRDLLRQVLRLATRSRGLLGSCCLAAPAVPPRDFELLR